MADARIKFLLDASSNFDSTSKYTQLLKSYYLCTVKNCLEDKLGGKFQYFENKDSCSKCLTNWIDGNYDLRVESNTVSQRDKRIIEALNSGQILARNQKVRAKLSKKKMFSYVEHERLQST